MGLVAAPLRLARGGRSERCGLLPALLDHWRAGRCRAAACIEHRIRHKLLASALLTMLVNEVLVCWVADSPQAS
jgi:hypothetical protein